ncbi:response regulator transcription factor [Actinocorallia sp. API 0066]|uniref:helix-turn-helix transcriptional regulator n=1 Tax=Actinocorallia sp. API 0066 TaxID=2896846 RepID=UPI001E3DF884|nr:response regulator transcription factor [Actinocorallia sp. API 0066]MCD0451294.1 response regulator transcription factor [Actinocorallia sp. API 0066]
MSADVVRVQVRERDAVLELGVGALLRDVEGIELVADAPDVVVAGAAGTEGVREVERLAAAHRVVALTSEDSPALLVGTVRAGAHAVLAHGCFGAAELAAAVRAAARGEGYLSPPVVTALVGWLHGGSPESPGRSRGFGHSLTPRETEVMELMARGWSNRRIASELYISEKTVKNHVHQIYRRLKADDREHAVARWRVLGPARS